jgi:hypothetical protein
MPAPVRPWPDHCGPDSAAIFLNGKILDGVHEFLISKTGSETGAKRLFQSNLARNKRVAS